MKNNTDIIFGTILLFNIFVIEFAGFFASNSVSVLAYSIFVFSEISVFIVFLKSVKKKVNKRASRFLGAAILIFSAVITNLLMQRYFFPEEVKGIVMVVFSIAGILLSTSVMNKVKNRYEKKNKKSFVDLMVSNIPSLLVFASGMWIMFTGESLADILSATIILFLIIVQAIRILRISDGCKVFKSLY